MGKIRQDYTFNKVTKQVTFTEQASIVLRGVLCVLDTTRHTFLFLPNVSGLGGTAATNVLTLEKETNTAGFDNADELLVYYDDKAKDPSFSSGDMNVNVNQALPTGTNTIGKVKATNGTYDLDIDSYGNAAITILASPEDGMPIINPIGEAVGAKITNETGSVVLLPQRADTPTTGATIAIPTLPVNSEGNPWHEPYETMIAEGDIPDHIPWVMMGLSPASTAAQTTLWNPGTEFVWPTANMQMEVTSSSVNDTAAGTGARTCTLIYLDSSGAEHTEIITLSGTGVVATVATNIFRPQCFCIATAGSGNMAAGTITLRHLADTPIYSQIAAGQTKARQAIKTVPAGYVVYITDVTFSAAATVAGKTVRMTLHATLNPCTEVISTPGTIFYPHAEIQVVDNTFSREFKVPLKFPGGVDLKMSVIGETTVVSTAFFRGWIEPA